LKKLLEIMQRELPVGVLKGVVNDQQQRQHNKHKHEEHVGNSPIAPSAQDVTDLIEHNA
jgi:hypothetical protein